MNCTPGSLAILVRNTSGLRCIGNVVGAPVRVTSLHSPNLFSHGPAWNYEAVLRCPSCQRRISILLDADLQPLRPDADETPAQIIEELTA